MPDLKPTNLTYLNGDSMIIQGYNPVTENPFDLYDTPLDVCESAVRDVLLPHYQRAHLGSTPQTMIDPGAGAGRWGYAMRKYALEMGIVGVELRDVPQPGAYDLWYSCTDFTTFTPQGLHTRQYDVVAGNPPYSVNEGKRDLILCEKFIRKGWSLLKLGGVLMFLLKTTYMQGKGRGESLFKEMRPLAVYNCIHRIGFRLNKKGKKGTNNVSYALYLWQKTPEPNRETRLYWWDYRTGEVC